MSELFSGVGVFILIALTIINLVIYHTIFSVTYFGSLGRHFIREVITAWIVAVLEMALIGSILMKIFGAVAVVLDVIEKILSWILMVIGTVYFYKNFKKALHYEKEKTVSQNKVIKVLQRIFNVLEYGESLTTKQQILYGLSAMIVIFEIYAASEVIGRTMKGSQTTQVADYNETTQYESTDVDSKTNDDVDVGKIEEKYKNVEYGSYRMRLNNEDNGWCEASVYENNGSLFLNVSGYIYGDKDVVDLSGQLEQQEDDTYAVNNLYVYDGDQYLGEDIPGEMHVEATFTNISMTLDIANTNEAIVNELNGKYNMLVNPDEFEGQIQKTEEYVWWDDAQEIDVCLEYTGETQGYATFNKTVFEENTESTPKKMIFLLVDESGIYGFANPETGEIDSMIFVIQDDTDGTEEYKRMYLMDSSNLSIYQELLEKDYAYSHTS